MNLYFFGGAFNPPHIGHKKIISYFIDRFEKILIVPSYKSPFKVKKRFISFEHRKNMIKIMLNKYPKEKFTILNHEEANKFIYTSDSIKYLKKTYKEDQFNLIMGLDQFNKFHLWKDYKYLLNNVNLVVISRPGVKVSNKDRIAHYIDDISIDVSSTDIKDKINDYGLNKNKMDKDVFNYIIENNLYQL